MLRKDIKIERQNLEWFQSQEREVKIALMSHTIEMMRIVINSFFETGVEKLCGKKYARGAEDSDQFDRWGYNPGSVRIGDEKVRVSVPRVMDKKKGVNVEFKPHKELQKIPAPDDQFLSRLILGISQNDYDKASRECAESFGLSQSSISRRFIDISSKSLKEFSSRDISSEEIVSIIIDGKHLYREQIIMCVGINIRGEKIMLDFIQSATENSRSVKQMLKRLIARGLRYDEGILFVTDGSKGIIKAIEEVFSRRALHQRCEWHKRENVVSHLKQEDQDEYRSRIQQAYNENDYEKAKRKLLEIAEELKKINITAYRSMMEGLEETLTLHRLKLSRKLRFNLGTTNIIESINSMVSRQLKRITRWHSSDQLFRWTAVSLMEIETRLRKIRNYRYLKDLRIQMKEELKIKNNKPKSLKAA